VPDALACLELERLPWDDAKHVLKAWRILRMRKQIKQ
jgi:hypothetical protein